VAHPRFADAGLRGHSSGYTAPVYRAQPPSYTGRSGEVSMAARDGIAEPWGLRTP
jgi:hypothetical protein